MKLKFNRLSLRFLRNFALLIMIPVFVFGLFINFYYNKYLIEQAELQMSRTVDTMAENLNSQIKNLSILSSALVHNSAFIKTIKAYNLSTDPKDDYYLLEEIDHLISNMFLYTNKIGTIYAYLADKPVYVYRNYPIVNNLPAVPLLAETTMHEDKVHENLVYIDDDLFSLYQTRNTELQKPLLVLSIYPDSFEYERLLEKLVFAFQLDLLDNIQKGSFGDYHLYITDKDQQIILADRNMPEQLRAITGIQKHGNASQPQHSGDRWLITGQNIPFTGWNIYYAAEKQVISAPFTRIKQLFNLGIAIIVFLFIWYSLLFFHNMVTPVNALISKMHLVKNGDYTVAAEATGPEEIQNLVLSFNTMIAEVKQLTEERETNEKERSRLEQEALQYQINPHFIANTLNSIRLMAIMNKDDHIKDMTASLMRLINDSFRSNGSCIRLDEELQNITGYIHIMKVRFGNRIELIDHTPANLADRQLLKMLIQPIVENSIVHGFSEMKGRCTIEISAELKQIADEEQPGKLLITIRDNGKGCSIDPNSPFPSSQSRNARGFTSLGLQNVHKRIILHYGNEFGLTMNSTIGKETSVIIALPNLTALEAPDV